MKPEVIFTLDRKCV